MVVNKYAKYGRPAPQPAPQDEEPPAKPNKYAKYTQPALDAAPPSDRTAPPLDFTRDLDLGAVKDWYSGVENRDGPGAQIPSWQNRPVDPLAPKGPPKPPPALYDAPLNVAEMLDSNLDKQLRNTFGSTMESVGPRTVDPTRAPISEQQLGRQKFEAELAAAAPPEPIDPTLSPLGSNARKGNAGLSTQLKLPTPRGPLLSPVDRREMALERERREAAGALGGGMDMMPTVDRGGNVVPGTPTDRDVSAAIIRNLSGMEAVNAASRAAEGVINLVGDTAQSAMGGQRVVPKFDAPEIPVPEALKSISGDMSGGIWQYLLTRGLVGKIAPGGGNAANAAKDAFSIFAGFDSDTQRMSETLAADFMRQNGMGWMADRDPNNPLMERVKNGIEEMLLAYAPVEVAKRVPGAVDALTGVRQRPMTPTNAGGAPRPQPAPPQAPTPPYPRPTQPAAQAAPQTAQQAPTQPQTATAPPVPPIPPTAPAVTAGAPMPGQVPPAGVMTPVPNLGPAEQAFNNLPMKTRESMLNAFQSAGVAPDRAKAMIGELNNLPAGQNTMYALEIMRRNGLSDPDIDGVLVAMGREFATESPRPVGRVFNREQDAARQLMNDQVRTQINSEGRSITNVAESRFGPGIVPAGEALDLELDQLSNAYETILSTKRSPTGNLRSPAKKDAVFKAREDLTNALVSPSVMETIPQDVKLQIMMQASDDMRRLKFKPEELDVVLQGDGAVLAPLFEGYGALSWSPELWSHLARQYPTQAAHSLQSALRKAADQAFRRGDATAGLYYKRLRGESGKGGLLDTLERAVPKYKETRVQYGDASSAKEALDILERFKAAAASEGDVAKIIKDLDGLPQRHREMAEQQITSIVRQELARKVESPRLAELGQDVAQTPNLTALSRQDFLKALEDVFGLRGKELADSIRASRARTDTLTSISPKYNSRTELNRQDVQNAPALYEAPGSLEGGIIDQGVKRLGTVAGGASLIPGGQGAAVALGLAAGVQGALNAARRGKRLSNAERNELVNFLFKSRTAGDAAPAAATRGPSMGDYAQAIGRDAVIGAGIGAVADGDPLNNDPMALIGGALGGVAGYGRARVRNARSLIKPPPSPRTGRNTPPAGPAVGPPNAPRPLPGQTSPSSPTIGGAALGALTGAALDQEDPARGALLGGIGGGALGAGAGRLSKGSTPKGPPPASGASRPPPVRMGFGGRRADPAQAEIDQLRYLNETDTLDTAAGKVSYQSEVSRRNGVQGQDKKVWLLDGKRVGINTLVSKIKEANANRPAQNGFGGKSLPMDGTRMAPGKVDIPLPQWMGKDADEMFVGGGMRTLERNPTARTLERIARDEARVRVGGLAQKSPPYVDLRWVKDTDGNLYVGSANNNIHELMVDGLRQAGVKMPEGRGDAWRYVDMDNPSIDKGGMYRRHQDGRWESLTGDMEWKPFDPSETQSSKLLAGVSGNARGIADNLKQDVALAGFGSVGGSFANQEDPQAGALGGMGIALGAKYGGRVVNALKGPPPKPGSSVRRQGVGGSQLPKDYKKSLAVVHNLSEANLLHADEIGGLAAPSLAVIDSDKGAMTGFGEVSLLADPNILKSGGIRTFDSDVYSPRHPRPQYKITDKKMMDFRDFIDKETEGLGDLRAVDWDSASREGPSALARNDQVRAAFLKSRGELPARLPRKKMPEDLGAEHVEAAKLPAIKDRWEFRNNPDLVRIANRYYENEMVRLREIDPSMAKKVEDRIFDVSEDGTRSVSFTYVDKFSRDAQRAKEALDGGVDATALSSIISKKLQNKKTADALDEYVSQISSNLFGERRLYKGMTYSGNRRYSPYTMENILREMTKTIRGGENWHYGAGSIRAKYARELKSLDEIRRNKDKLVASGGMEDAKKAIQDKLSDLIFTHLEKYYRFGGGNRFSAMDEMSKAIADGPRALREVFDFKGNPEPMQRIQEFIDELKSMPTEYFEAKANRAVGLNEFAVAIVPKGASPKTIDALKRAGLKIKYYTKGDEASRAKAIQSEKQYLAGLRGNPEAIGAGLGTVFAPDADGDGEVSFGERAGAAITGGVMGRGARAIGNRLGGAGGVKPPPAGKFRGPNNQTFAGVNAKTADKAALARAQNMEAEGASRDAIWDQTGWFKGVDGKWRFEIDDSGAKATSAQNRKLRSDALEKQLGDAETASIIWHRADRNGISAEAAARDLSTELGRPIGPSLVDAAKARTRSEHMAFIADLEQQLAAKNPDMKLGEAVGHSAVYDAYPDMAERPFKQFGLEGGLGARAAYNEPTDTFLSSQFQRPEEELSSSLHEMQHGVQGREGFARGGSPENVLSKDLDAINQRMSAIVRENDALKQKRLSSDTPWVEDAAIAKNERLYKDLMDQRSNDFSPENEFKAYKRLAGETEARNVQTRRDFTPAERRARRPWETQDVPDDQQIVRFGGGKAESRPKGPPSGNRSAAMKYPTAPKGEWYGDANYQTTGGRMTEMTPDEFLARARPMKIDDVARENIDDLKAHIKSGKTLDPLALHKSGKEDGRHRAIAARELGIEKVPVLVWGDAATPTTSVPVTRRPPEQAGFFGGARPPANRLSGPPKPPGTLSRMVAGGAIGGIAGGVAGEADPQTAETAQRIADNKAQQEVLRADIKKLEADKGFFRDAEITEIQKRLKREGKNIGNTGPNRDGVDGINKGLTQKGIEEFKAQIEADLNAAYARRTTLETRAEKLKQDASFEATRPTDEQQQFRDFAPLVGGVVGAALGKSIRLGGSIYSKAAAKPVIARLDALLNATPIAKPKTPAQRAAVMSEIDRRASDLNEFWREGGANTPRSLSERVGMKPTRGVPFASKGNGDWAARAPRNVMSPSELFPDRFIGRNVGPVDALVGGAGATEAYLADQNAQRVKGDLNKAYIAAKDDPSEKNLARVQELEDQYALSKGWAMLGTGLAVGTGIGVFTSKYARKRGDVSTAEQELAILRRAIADLKKQTNKAAAPPKPPVTPPVVTPPPVAASTVIPPLPPARPRRTQRPPIP